VHLRRARLAAVLAAAALSAAGCASGRRGSAQPRQPRGIDVDFLLSYYDQSGEHSAVTGGTGTEDQQVLSPVILVGWAVSEDWSLRTDLGVDQITAASVDAIDTEVSSASRVDQRAFADLTATRRVGERSTVSYTHGISNEYDYQSLSGAVGYTLDVNERNTTLAARLRHYEDTVKLYDIDGKNRGDDSRRTTDLGVDQITAASVDAIDTEVSSASRVDQRAFADLTATRRGGERSTVSYTLGISNEYDYQSLSGAVGYTLDLNERNTTLAARLRHYEDTVKLYDIDGVNRGDEGRRTTDLALTLTQVLGPRTVGSIELDSTYQTGFLSTPFHEVALRPPGGGEVRVAERLPDSRRRISLGLSLDHAFGGSVVQKLNYRFYDDNWGIRAHTIAAETHFRLPVATDTRVFPILRYHRQSASDYFGPTGSFTGSEEFFTSDWDLAEITTTKYGIGLGGSAPAGQTWWLGLRRYETRFTLFSRDDGLDGMTASFGLGWTL
jgi:hypothetical protein